VRRGGRPEDRPGGKSLAVVNPDPLPPGRSAKAEGPAPEEAKLPAAVRRRATAVAPSPGALGADEVRRVFPAEEIARLKLVLLTAVDPSAKVEALRRLALAPVANEEKGILALRAIADPAPDVRREAAQVLERMGLDPELADALRSASTGTARQKEIALRRIAQLGRAAGATEQSVAMAALVSALEFEKEPDVLKEILAALSAFAGPITSRPEMVSSLARQLVRLASPSPRSRRGADPAGRARIRGGPTSPASPGRKSRAGDRRSGRSSSKPSSPIRSPRNWIGRSAGWRPRICPCDRSRTWNRAASRTRASPAGQRRPRGPFSKWCGLKEEARALLPPCSTRSQRSGHQARLRNPDRRVLSSERSAAAGR
jgi:hypothetical protein